MKNALESMKEQKANLDLANEISRVTRVKYQNGVGSNLEVLNAESSIKESQANYFTALYNALVAKVELEKANRVNDNAAVKRAQGDITSVTKEIDRATKAPAKAASLPKGVPQGSVDTGKYSKDGKKVYRDRSGQLHTGD
jgi:hypothetical protein